MSLAASNSRSGRATLRRVAGLYIAAIAACVTACGGGETPSSVLDDTTLTIHVPDQDERALGPLGVLWFPVFLGLTEGEEDLGRVPKLLDSWEHTPDYTEWTVHVREGLKWGDGEDVTARDVKFSLELWTHPEIGYEGRFFETIEILDSYSLRITFPDPPPATIFVYNWLAIVPEHLLANNSIDEFFSWPFWIQPLGNGPFRYARHIADVMTELERNPLYYGAPPQIERVVLRYGGNALTELLSGNVDIATSVTPIQAGLLLMDPRFRLYFRPGAREVAIAWNHDNLLFADVEVRRALTMAIDRRELHRLLNYPDDTPIVDVPTRRRHYAGGILPEPLPFAPARSDLLLSEAGWLDTDGDGIRERDGVEFRFTLIATPSTAAQAVFLETAFRGVGVTVDLRIEERGVHRQRMLDRDFDALIQDYNFLEQFGDFPTTGYKNAEVSRLRDAAWFTIDTAQADAALFQLWDILGEEIPVTYLHPKLIISAAHRRVRGMETDHGSLGFVEYLSLADEEIQ